jgi:type II secretory pathway component PulF
MVAVMLAWFGLILSVYYVPRLVALWADLERPLSRAERLLVNVSDLIDRGFIILAPVLLLASIAIFAWRVRAVRKARATDAV